MMNLAKQLRRSRFTVYFLYAATLWIFATDSLTQLGFAHALFYTPLIILAGLTARRKHLLNITLLAVAFTLLGYFISPPAPPQFSVMYVWANRVASVASILAIAWLTLLALTYQEKLAQQLIKIKKRDLKLKRTTRLARVCEWHYDIARDTIVLSKEAAALCDIDEREVLLGNFTPRFFGQGRLMLESLRKKNALPSTERPRQNEMEAVVITRDHEKRYVRLLAYDNDPETVIGIMQDVTAQKREQMTLSREVEKYRELTHTAPIILWQADRDGNIYDANDSLVFAVGGDAKEQVKNWLALYHPDDQSRALSRWMRAVKTGQPFQMEYRLRHQDNNYYWYLGTAKPQLNQSGQIEGWVGATVNIDHLKQSTDNAS